MNTPLTSDVLISIYCHFQCICAFVVPKLLEKWPCYSSNNIFQCNHWSGLAMYSCCDWNLYHSLLNVSWCYDACLSLVIQKGLGWTLLSYDDLTKTTKKKSHQPWPWLVNKEYFFCFRKTLRQPSCVVPGWVFKILRLCQTKLLIFNKHIAAILPQIKFILQIICILKILSTSPIVYHLETICAVSWLLFRPSAKNHILGTNIKRKSPVCLVLTKWV